jgi:fatty-acid desaturase
MICHLTIPLATSYYLLQVSGVILYSLLLIFLYNLGDSIDSAAHLLGERIPETRAGAARNNTILGYLTLGEGWHANHHLNPSCARHGLQPDQFDWTWQVIKGLEKFGLASKVKVPAQNN